MTRTLRAFAVVLVALAAAAPVLTAQPAAAALVSFPDPTGDAAAQTDVIVASLSFGDGEIGAYVEIPGGPDPTTDPVWLDNNRTTSHFFFDIDGDGTADYTANYWWANTQTQQGLWSITSHYSDQDTAINCNATAGTWLSNGGTWRAYGIRFPKSCIDNPTSVSFRAMTDYGEVQNDMVPDTGFSPAVGECIGGCAPVWPSSSSSTTTTTITTTPPPAGSTPPPATGTNGQLAYATNRGTYTNVLGQVAAINNDGSDDRIVASGSYPDWSPDGSKIVFGEGTIYTVNADGTGLTALGDGFMPKWSPDGTRIVFSDWRGTPSGTWDIFVMNADGSGRRNLKDDPYRTSGNIADLWPDWGLAAIVFAEGDDSTLKFLEPTFGGIREVVLDRNTVDSVREPEWSPDGSRIVFSGYSPTQGGLRIYSVAPDGTSLRQLTTGPSDREPAWSPDGNWIAFSASVGSDSAIFAMRSDGSSRSQLTEDAWSESQPSWGTYTPSPSTTTTTAPPTTTTTTTRPGSPQPSPPPTAPPSANPQPVDPGLQPAATSSGYAMVSADGQVYPFGAAPFCGHVRVTAPERATDVEITPNGKGYWVLLSDGYVDFKWCANGIDDDWGTYEHNNFFADRLNRGEKAVSLSVLPDGSGYWVFTDRGRALAFGKAQWFGDMSGVALNGPVLGSVATPDGRGYWMVASDGGIFAFGNAKFAGSMGGRRLNAPVMSMAPDPDGAGYWLVASDGGIFAFGAGFYGSMGGTKLNKPISGMVPGRAGYLMVAEDGGIFAFGDVRFHGSLGATPPSSKVVAVALLG